MSDKQTLVQAAVDAFLEYYEAERLAEVQLAKSEKRPPGIPAYPGEPRVIASALKPNEDTPASVVIVLESGHKFTYDIPTEGESEAPKAARGRGRKKDALETTVEEVGKG